MAQVIGKLAGNISVTGQGQKNSPCELTVEHEFKITHDDKSLDFELGSKKDEKITAFVDYDGNLRGKINSTELENWWLGEEDVDWRYGVPISFAYSTQKHDYLFKFDADYTITTNKDDGNNLMVVKENFDLTADSVKIYNYYKTGTLRVYRRAEDFGFLEERFDEILSAKVTVKGERLKHSSGNITLDIIPISSDVPQSFIQTRQFRIRPVDVDADNGSFQNVYTTFIVTERTKKTVGVTISAASSGGVPIVSIKFNLINDGSERPGKVTFN